MKKNQKNIIDDDEPIWPESKLDPENNEPEVVLENSERNKNQKIPKKQSMRNVLRSYKEDYPISQEEYVNLRQKGVA